MSSNVLDLVDNRHLPSDHPLFGKRVAIVGAGPAGLTLARLLEQSNACLRVFERDATAHARSQGGSLDLRENSGQLALDRCGLTGRFVAMARPEGQMTTVLDKLGKRRAVMTADDEGEARPEIDRGTLRNLLLSSLSANTVLWDHALSAIDPEAGGGYRLSFSNGQSALADLVVGADGSRSKVRPLITPIGPFYTGVTFIEARLSEVDRRHPHISQLVGPGHVIALGDNKGLLAQRNGDGSVRVYVAQRIAEHWLRDNGLDVRDSLRTREQLLAWFEDWSPELSDMVRRSDDAFLPWPLYASPPDQRWEALAGATLIGDAAHVMPPFLGEGANMAMLDAVELAEHLLAGRSLSLAEAIAAFEGSMFERTAPLIREALDTQDLLFAVDAPNALADRLTSSV